MASTYAQIHRYGTQAQYDALETKNPNYLYFTSDTKKLYKGADDYTDSLMTTSTVGASGVAGKIYLESTTGQVKVYVGNAWKTISYPMSNSTFDNTNASSVTVPSQTAVVDYVESVIGGEGGQILGSIEQKMNGTTAVSGVITATQTNGTTYDVALQGVTVNPTWDSETRVLKLPVVGANGTTSEVSVDIGKDIFIDPGEGKNYFDPSTKEIVLTLNNGTSTSDPTVIRIPASALYNDYTGGTTNSGTVSIDATSHTITFDLNVNSSTANSLTLDSNGLMVDLTAYSTTADVEGIRSNLQGEIDDLTTNYNATTAALDTLTTNYNATTASLNTLTSNYNATTAALDTLTSNYNATTAALDTLTSNYNATTAALNSLDGEVDTLTSNYNATTAALDTLTSNYNATTAALDTLTSNYNATTAALDTLTSNYNATTATVADIETSMGNLAEASTTWAGFTD